VKFNILGNGNLNILFKIQSCMETGECRSLGGEIWSERTDVETAYFDSQKRQCVFRCRETTYVIKEF
jgi:hypothetical protein